MSERFVSYAQNGEDVVLWRALGGLVRGTYVDVGANEPRHDSVSYSFYRRGWRGVTIEPLPDLVAMHREERPGDVQVEAVAAAREGEKVTLHQVPGTGLSTVVDGIGARHAAAGLEVRDVEVETTTLDAVLAASADRFGPDVHFLSIDVEGFEGAVLEGLDLTRFRPWVLVIEARAPQSVAAEELEAEFLHAAWEPQLLAGGYVFCLDDGISRFYVAAERAAELQAPLSYAACVLDPYVDWRYDELRVRYETARDDALRWRGVALEQWVAASQTSGADVDALRQHAAYLEREIAALRTTLSWRVTAPLRWARERQLGSGGTS